MRVAWLIPLVAAAALVSGCKVVKPDDQEQEPAAAASSPPKKLVLPVAEAPLDRETLLLAALRAGSARASGIDDSGDQVKLAGRRFELRIRFGCPTGAGALDASPGWMASFEEPRRILRLRVDPDINEETPLLRDAAEGAFEDASGFWLRRPWMLTASCPPLPPAPEPSPSASTTPSDKPAAKTTDKSPPPPEPAISFPRVGIVQGYTADDPRTHRARQAYEVTRRLAADLQPSTKGYDLVLAGRLRRLPQGKVITCRQEQRDQPPACLVTVAFDRIALTSGDTGEEVADWTGTAGI